MIYVLDTDVFTLCELGDSPEYLRLHTLYGTTTEGGASNAGTVFAVTGIPEPASLSLLAVAAVRLRTRSTARNKRSTLNVQLSVRYSCNTGQCRLATPLAG